MPDIKPIYLSLISGALLILAWPPLPTAFLLFIAFVPLFLIHKQFENSRKKHVKFWSSAYLSLLIFNTGATWWVWNASPSGCIMMLLLNSLVMSLPFLGFSLVRVAAPRIAYMAFVLFYLCFEYWHFNWSASWPWMTIGKGLASMPFYIQWYEFTGELGGSALILAVNVWISSLLLKKEVKKLWQPLALVLGFGIISVLVALKYSSQGKGGKALECVISQPNIDPYTEKFGDGPGYLYPEIQLEYAIEVSKQYMTPKTDILLMPETAIVGSNDEARLAKSELLKPLFDMCRGNELTVLAGAETYSLYDVPTRPSLTARYDSFSSLWYDNYNTALLIDSSGVNRIYHKSRLVPGVEKMPFEFLENLSIELGGTSGSLGTSKEPINFTLNDGSQIAPLICYESVFGDYVNEFVRKGANILAVVTNDGWWRETPGYAQHLLYGAVRCIETRREMIRSANTGVSAKIDRLGHITHRTQYNERVAFACQAIPYDQLTFYVRYGNLIGKLSCLLSMALLVFLAIRRLGRKNRQAVKG